ncbi:MAG: PQQ-dependent sugar dehydrogenase [Deltaproteobacteria bacterium]|nr:PQQ-dependent sugar dehydrogenase [Deltaproteobacteria bacterium]
MRVVVVLALVTISACARPAVAEPPPATAVQVAPWVRLDVEGPIRVTAPVGLVAAHDGSRRLFVIEQGGVVRVLNDGKLQEAPFLDVRHLLGGVGGEQGLLGLVFHPRFKENGRLFIGYTDSHDNDAYAELRASADHARVDAATLRVLFSIPDFAGNHNGGHLVFGPDGKLWIGTGDGGGAGDPKRTAQDEGSLLGKMLRVDVDTLGPAPQLVTPERWAKGLRNPWRYAFDRQNGDLWIADVGQNLWEEVHLVERAAEQRGLNFGWSVLEGAHCFRPEQGCEAAGLVSPVFEYRHGDDGCSITGGVVYRGKRFPALVGSYVVADYCSSRLWTLKREGARVLWARAGHIPGNVSGFGEDEDGELWVADHQGRVLRLVAFLPR